MAPRPISILNNLTHILYNTMEMKKIIALLLGGFILSVVAVALLVLYVSSTLPQLKSIQDYKPLLVSEVYDRKGEKIGEFFREKRIVVPYKDLPPLLTKAFIAAEDGSFFQHGGVNYVAIMRAMLANIQAGRKVQGGSTITQQTAKTLFLSNERTIIRKIKDVLLAFRLEENLSKEDILYLYLNQIYFGQGAYGVQAASQIYYQKDVKDLTLAEMAILAGLPQAPSRYTPIYEPKKAKDRQRYVLQRMAEEGFITEEVRQKTVDEPVTVYVRKNYTEVAPYFLETVRQYLVTALGEDEVLNKGIRIYTSVDLHAQLEARKQIREGLREVDKRQGFRGPIKNITDPNEVAQFLLKTRDALIDENTPQRVINADGTSIMKGPFKITDSNQPQNAVPEYVKLDKIVDGVVTKIDDKWGLTYIRFAEGQGLIDVETMKWARKPNPQVSFMASEINKPSQALKVGDVIQVRVSGKKFYSTRLTKELGQQKLKKGYKPPEDLPVFDNFARLELEQEPIAEGALVSLNEETDEVLAMVGGYDFEKSEFNRALQAARQTGSSFKPIVYAAAMDTGFKPNTTIIDAPVVYQQADESEASEGQGDIEKIKTWKPGNFGSEFTGDILFRNAIIQSKNIPTVKILEKIGIDVVAAYARRLQIFSPLNMDLSLGLGSSGVTLYEMTKVASIFGRLGKKSSPIFIKSVKTRDDQVLLENVSMDMRFESEMKEFEDRFEKIRQSYVAEALQSLTPTDSIPGVSLEKLKKLPLFFPQKEQLISPQTAYLITSLMRGVIMEKGGTGGAARALGREVAGKTGTTNGYYDAWFIGFTPQIATGVWVGFDNEQTLGIGETGGRAALPIWLEYMKEAHKDLPRKTFSVPEKIVFVSIDNETGKVATAQSKEVVKQAFLEGTEPTTSGDSSVPTEQEEEEKSFFYKQDLNE